MKRILILSIILILIAFTYQFEDIEELDEIDTESIQPKQLNLFNCLSNCQTTFGNCNASCVNNNKGNPKGAASCLQGCNNSYNSCTSGCYNSAISSN